ncbi:MAG: tellurium resistance protein [Defluviimonas sp.]|uniref:SLAC1 family transporter n=1 Tax=Albidovulum sp. TaxID=1872424 RepID=UPI002A27516A|nr:tellurium resistance protein [Defluviimonas sp.]
MPPAVFPSIFGLFGLGLALRRAAASFALPAAIGEIVLGAVTLLYLAALAMYLAKSLRRPAALVEDLRILPGRAGVTTMVLSLYLLSLVLAPYDGAGALWILYAGFALHLVLVALVLFVYATGPAEQRRVNPVWHLIFVGPIIGALAALTFELYSLALVIFAISALLAALIWSVSLDQILKEDVPGPLRPLLAIHLAPLALLGLVAEGLELQVVAGGFAAISAMLLAWLVLRVRWLTAWGFSALWGAFTFPLAATASLWIAVGGIWRVPGALALVLALLVILPIAAQVLRLWFRGTLAVKTNAASA